MRYLVAISLWLAASSVHAAEGSSSAVGDVRLASGLAAHYAYHYDRNALRDSRHVGDALIALTRSGNLLRFDAKTLKLTGEWFGPVTATCLGRGENEAVLVGFEDGLVCRVDPADLALVEVARLPAKVQWVGWSPRGLVAVVERPLRFERQGRVAFGWSTEIHDLATGKAFPLPKISGLDVDGRTTWHGGRPTAFLLDRKRRLWLGGDEGEWGGWLVRADLDLARVEPVFCFSEDGYPGGWSGIYGLVELPDGQVWAHGGTMHMGLSGGFISRVDGSFARNLYLYDNDPPGGDEDNRVVPPRRPPYHPTTHILPDAAGKLLVLAYSDVYRVDTGLEEWTKDHTLAIRYRWGRPDAVGAYPSVVAVHRIGDRLVCATGVDGYVSIAGGKESSHALPGQFGLDRAWRIANSAEGMLFSPWDDREPTWRLGDGGWEVADLAPPCELVPNDPYFKNPDVKPTWAATRVLVGPGQIVHTVSATNGSGTNTTARRVAGKAEILGRESFYLNVSGSLITPDGALWNARYGDLRRFADGRWQSVAPLAGGGPVDEQVPRTGAKSFPIGYGLQAIGDAGPPWTLLDRDSKQLLRLAYGPGFQDPKLDAVKIMESNAALKIHDAIPETKGELLLATDKGLRRFDITSAKIQPSPLPVPDRPIMSLARDGLGRVWMGGDGLWVVDADGKTLHDCAAVPMIGRTSVVTTAADPGRRDGVIVSLGERGVVFVGVSAGAAR